jgi:hypothetical protein
MPSRVGLEILQAEELPRAELLRGPRSVHHHLHDLRREALDVVHGRAQLLVERRDEIGVGRGVA